MMKLYQGDESSFSDESYITCKVYKYTFYKSYSISNPKMANL